MYIHNSFPSFPSFRLSMHSKYSWLEEFNSSPARRRYSYTYFCCLKFFNTLFRFYCENWMHTDWKRRSRAHRRQGDGRRKKGRHKEKVNLKTQTHSARITNKLISSVDYIFTLISHSFFEQALALHAAEIFYARSWVLILLFVFFFAASNFVHCFSISHLNFNWAHIALLCFASLCFAACDETRENEHHNEFHGKKYSSRFHFTIWLRSADSLSSLAMCVFVVFCLVKFVIRNFQAQSHAHIPILHTA